MMKIRAPATSANLGPGFDCLGVALSLFDRFEAEESDRLLVSGCRPELAGSDNLFVRAYRRGLEELGLPFRGLRLVIQADIPIARGLGSSAACIVGGLLAASHCAPSGEMRWGALGRDRLLDLAAELEGHPDNVAPALLGGFRASVVDEGRVTAIGAEVAPSLVFHALVPPFELSTSLARAALPAELPFRDAVFDVGRAALVCGAFLSRDYGKLGAACADRLHEPYRAPLIRGFGEVVERAKAAGALAVFLSGAGPTVMALELRDAVGPSAAPGLGMKLDELLASMRPLPWRRFELVAAPIGARFETD
jgi:homoserine kinase